MSTLHEDIVAICRLFSVFERSAICGGTVTVAQCVLLQTLLQDSHDLSSLASSTQVTKGAMTRLVDGLEKRGLVERVADEEDGRRFFVELTKAGRWEANRLARETRETIKTVFSTIPAAKHKQVEQSIALLRTAMESSMGAICCGA